MYTLYLILDYEAKMSNIALKKGRQIRRIRRLFGDALTWTLDMAGHFSLNTQSIRG